ncbi:hypothetical protein GC096_03685 [Paenibacillus sp. LMG 31461]|uniref:Uncharacterized protein n=1 Tax=Paenibacillus plantarum TaxID=2654975 RepID=A0ABX1X408_9BACL|nr:hypothetical protein [Paenibacillus plantarum]NOU63147.1 hypothetical protein [Paenibacillus plantarum]
MKIYYDEDPENAYNPYRVIISLENTTIDWDKKIFYISLPDKFEKVFHEDFNEDIMSISIQQGDLLLHPMKVNTIGIYLPNIVNRIEKLIKDEKKNLLMAGTIYSSGVTAAFEYNNIKQFIIYISDLSSKGIRINQFFGDDW